MLGCAVVWPFHKLVHAFFIFLYLATLCSLSTSILIILHMFNVLSQCLAVHNSCKQLFSKMINTKSSYCSQLTNHHLNDILLLSTSSIKPDIELLMWQAAWTISLICYLQLIIDNSERLESNKSLLQTCNDNTLRFKTWRYNH